MNGGKIKRIVVRGTNWVGDAVMSVPALKELRRILPDAHITLCTRGWAQGIFADTDFIDDILIYDKQKNRFNNVLQGAREWRKHKFDLAILLNNAFESAVLARFGGAKRSLGYRTEGRGILLTDSIPVPAWKNERHEVYYYLNLIAELEIRLFGETQVWQHEPQISLAVSDQRQQRAREMLAENGIDLSRKFIAFCPGSTNSRAKRWEAESYAELSDLMQDSLKVQVVLTGSPDEVEVSQKVWEKSKSKPILLTGKTTLAEAVAVLGIADLLVTNDTGPAHIAPALGTKTIVIFGPTRPETTRPFSDLAQIIVKPPICAPCMLRDCPIDHRCMKTITPPEILAMIKPQIN